MQLSKHIDGMCNRLKTFSTPEITQYRWQIHECVALVELC